MSMPMGVAKWGNDVPLFGASAGYQRQDSTIFSDNPQMTTPPPSLGLGSVGDYFGNLLGAAAGTVGDTLNAIAQSFYIQVDGKTIEYSAFRMPDGRVRVGSIRPDPKEGVDHENYEQ